jgi:rhodanese-related sulfurtransferase/signal-transduction protein with cAMP-binding, CBS, and nucleotidyltransferase domain
MQGAKLQNIANRLLDTLFPFNLLSKDRAAEVANSMRFVEMCAGESFHVRGGANSDYLIVAEGELQLIEAGRINQLVAPKDTIKKPIMIANNPTNAVIVALQYTIACFVDREVLESLMSWDDLIRLNEENKELHYRLELVRNSLIFRRLPFENVETAFKRMKHLPVKAGDVITRQGASCDAYYIITHGRAEVWRVGVYDDDLQKLATLKVGDAFGEEALISGAFRSETVTMIEDGALLVLTEEDFRALVTRPMVKSINDKVALSMIESGYELLDVRYQEEYDEIYIPGCRLLTLHDLRKKISTVDPDKKYVVYCHAGIRSSAAVLILSEHEIEAYSLEGGILNWPHEVVRSD